MRKVWYVIFLELIIISCISFSDVNTGEKKGEQKIYVGGDGTTEDAGEALNAGIRSSNARSVGNCDEQRQKAIKD